AGLWKESGQGIFFGPVLSGNLREQGQAARRQVQLDGRGSAGAQLVARVVQLETNGGGGRVRVDVRMHESQQALELCGRRGAGGRSHRQGVLFHLGLLVKLLLRRQEAEVLFVNVALDPDRGQIGDVVDRHALVDVLALLDVLLDDVAVDGRAD